MNEALLALRNPQRANRRTPTTPGRYDPDGFEIFPQAVLGIHAQLKLRTTYTPGQPGNPTKTAKPPPKLGF